MIFIYWSYQVNGGSSVKRQGIHSDVVRVCVTMSGSGGGCSSSSGGGSASSKVSSLTSLFEKDKNSNVIGQQNPGKKVEPVKGGAAAGGQSERCAVAKSTTNAAGSSSTSGPKTVQQSLATSTSGSNKYLIPDFRSTVTEYRPTTENSVSGKVFKAVRSYESSHERSLYLYGKKKMLSTSDIIGSEKSFNYRDFFPCKIEGPPLEHTSSADNLLVPQKPKVKKLILQRKCSLEDTYRSPEHNDLKECEFIMGRLADTKLKELRNMFEKSVGLADDRPIPKSPLTNAKTATLGHQKTSKSSMKSLTLDASYRTPSFSISNHKPVQFGPVPFSQDKMNIFKNIKFEIDSLTLSVGTRSLDGLNQSSETSVAGRTSKSKFAENSSPKRHVLNNYRPADLPPLYRMRSSSPLSSSSSTSSSCSVERSNVSYKKRASYENVNPSENCISKSRVSSTSDSDPYQKMENLSLDGTSKAYDTDVYDDVSNTVHTDLEADQRKWKLIVSSRHYGSETNGDFPENSYNSVEDDDGDHYELIEPYSIKCQQYSDSTMKKSEEINGGPPPIPPRDRISEAPPLPPRKHEDTVNLRTIVPPTKRTSQIFRNDNYLHGQIIDSSSSESVSSVSSAPVVPPGNKPSEIDGKKLNSRYSGDYLSMSGPLFSKSPSEASITSVGPPFQDLQPEYTEDSLYGVSQDRYSSCFEMEPLYQFCGADTLKKTRERLSNRGSHIYCEIGETEQDESLPEEIPTTIPSGTQDSSSSRSSQLGCEFLRPNSQRTLWHEMPQVKNSNILDTISDSERKCQEAIFEVITSEASYLKSLNILMNTFLFSPQFSDKSDKSVLIRQERHELFSNIGAVRETSEKLLADLEARWKKSPLIHDICDIITKHVHQGTFNVYIRYCTNMTYQERMYNKLMKRVEFVSALKEIERNDICQRLPMKTFLLLPMQRITRIPLLIDSICHRLDSASDQYKSAIQARSAINKIVKQCNDGARQMERMEELIAIKSQLQFKVKEFPLISASRYLVKKGEVTEIVSDSNTKNIFKRSKPTKNPLYLFLFNDILLVTKKRGNHYDVVDYCWRAFLDSQHIRDPDKCKLLPQGVPQGARYLMLLVMFENCESRRVEMVLAHNSENDCERWLDVVTSVTVEGNERIYAQWDCPQVQAISRYEAREGDELSLEENDMITVLRKLNDGWYYGEKSDDSEMGWFPAEATKEIDSEHIRARNLRLKYQVEGHIEVE